LPRLLFLSEVGHIHRATDCKWAPVRNLKFSQGNGLQIVMHTVSPTVGRRAPRNTQKNSLRRTVGDTVGIRTLGILETKRNVWPLRHTVGDTVSISTLSPIHFRINSSQSVWRLVTCCLFLASPPRLSVSLSRSHLAVSLCLALPLSLSLARSQLAGCRWSSVSGRRGLT